ncbi:hypothetical protein ACUXST_001079 [Sphingomonas sp. F9_3S_D5_B_2]
MRKLSRLGVAAIIAAGAAGTAVGAAHSTHVMTVPLPDGSVARVEYVGDVPPKVTVAPSAGIGVPAGMPLPAFGGLFEQMDREMAAAMRQIDQVARQPLAAPGAGMNVAAFGNLPAGTTSYSSVTVDENGHRCLRSTQVIADGAGKPPKVISNVSGECAAAKSPPAAAKPSGPVHQS